MIPVTIKKSKFSNQNNPNDCSDCVCPVILMIPAIIWKSIYSDRDDHSDERFVATVPILVIVTIVHDHSNQIQ